MMESLRGAAFAISPAEGGQLIATGLSMGIVHVLTGPDHLSALATLAVGSKYRAFYLGIRWGLGHSTGLILVAVILLSLGNKVDTDALEHTCNWVVGAFMIALGIYGCYKAYKMEKRRRAEEAETNHAPLASSEKDGKDEEDSTSDETEGEGDIELAHVGQDDCEHATGTVKDSEQSSSPSAALTTAGAPDSTTIIRSRKLSGEITNASSAGAEDSEPFLAHRSRCRSDVAGQQQRGHRCCCLPRHSIYLQSPMVQRLLAFSIGVLHGIGGNGSILGVLPAVQLHSWSKASLYLGTFCLTSTFVMGIFAALYGEITHRIGSAKKLEFRLELFSASLSIIVGVVWIVLILAGKLTAVFG